MKKRTEFDTTVCRNRRATYDYHILDHAEAGIKLLGSEVKSIRQHNVSLDGAYVKIEAGEVWLIGCRIELYPNAAFDHDPTRNRKLLLTRHEIQKFAEKAVQKGFTLIPLRMYFKHGLAKVEVVIAKGKQLHDKRQTLKKRDAERNMRN
jgi:SsrA-binding protein